MPRPGSPSPLAPGLHRPCLHVLGAAGLFKPEPFANPSVEAAAFNISCLIPPHSPFLTDFQPFILLTFERLLALAQCQFLGISVHFLG